MAQTQLDYNEYFFGVKGEPARIADGTILSGQGELDAGTVLVLQPSSGKYVAWDSATQEVVTESGTPDTTVDLDTTPVAGVAILLEDVDATSADADGKVGLTGGVTEDFLTLAGSAITTVTDFVRAVLRMNNLYPQKSSNAMSIAGE